MNECTMVMDPATDSGVGGSRKAEEEVACLIVTHAPQAAAIGTVFRIDRDGVELGRHSDPAFAADPGISRRHLRVQRDPAGGYRLADLRSKNGTYLNGQLTNASTLHEGDVIRVGAFVALRFSLRGHLGDNEEKLRQALAAGRVGTWDWDLARRRVAWSDHVDRMFELPIGSLSNRSDDLYDFVHPDDRASVAAAVEAAAQHRSKCDLEFRMQVGATGASYRWVASQGEVLRDHDGKAVRITGTILDITERRRQEEEARRLALFETLYDAIVVFDVDGRIVDWNGSAEKMFGWHKDEVLRRDVCEVLGVSVGALRGAPVIAQLGTTGRWSGDLDARRRDGSVCPCETVVVPMQAAEGRAVAYVSLHRDITMRRQLQSRLVFSDRMASVGCLAAGVAHEINNPLTYIISNLSLLAEELDQLDGGLRAGALEDFREMVGDTQRGVDRIREIVQDLKVFSGHKDAKEDSLTPVDVKRVLSFACKMASIEVRHRGRLVLEPGEVPPALACESRLSQVFLNLLMNAAHALPEGAAATNTITVRTRLDASGRIAVEVADTGCGIPKENLARIFDPFFTTKSVGKGSGLGLSICHTLITAIGGEIRVDSEPGRGTTFTVLLPPATVVTKEPATSKVPILRLGRAQILVIDDEPLVGASIKRLLSRDHDVTTVQGGREALRLIGEGKRYDLVLCDVLMPHMSGPEVCAALELASPDQAQRMVFITGGGVTLETERFMAERSRRLVRKPLDPALLRNLAVESVAASEAGAAAEAS